MENKIKNIILLVKDFNRNKVAIYKNARKLIPACIFICLINFIFNLTLLWNGQLDSLQDGLQQSL